MRAFLMRFLRRLLAFLEPKNLAEAKARELILWAKTLQVKNQEVSGQRKRRQVLLRLQAEYPTLPVKELSFLIEKILQEV